MKLQLGIRSWEQSERSSTRSLPLDLKFGGAEIRSKFEVRSSRRLGIGSLQLDSKPGSSLEGVDAKFAVDLKFGDCIRSWRLEVRGSLPLGFEVRSIQRLGVAEEGVDAKFDVKRAEIKY